MRLGVLGGTFDPIHLGHLLLAEQARESLELDRVLLVPAARPPHKADGPRTSHRHRFRMLELALEGIPGLVPSDLERDEARPSYTVETLARVRAELESNDQIFLLLGTDSLRDLPTWREPERISRLARLAVYPRPGEEIAPSPSHGEVLWLDGPRLRLSATEVRARIAAGRSVRFLVPDVVREYIDRHGLYLDPIGSSKAEGGES